MKQRIFASIALALLVAGCGGGGSSSSGTTTGATTAPAISSQPTAIVSADSGAKAALSGVAVTEGGYDMGSSSSSFQGLAFGTTSGLSKETSAVKGTTINLWMQRLANDAAPLNTVINWRNGTAKTVAATTDMSASLCTTGTATITSSESGASIDYSNCRFGSIQLNGTISVSGTSNTNTVSANYSIGSASSPFTTTFYADTTSSVKESEDRSVLTMTGFTANTTTGAISATLNGTYTEEDYVLKTKYETIISNFKTSYEFINGIYSVDITGGSFVDKEYTLVNGVYNQERSVGVTFQNFGVDRYFSTGTYSVNGTFAIQSTPSTCIDGTFAIKTITPIKDDRTAGVMTVNDNTTITFSSTGVTVAVTGQPTKTYSSFSELSGVCTQFGL